MSSVPCRKLAKACKERPFLASLSAIPCKLAKLAELASLLADIAPTSQPSRLAATYGEHAHRILAGARSTADLAWLSAQR